MGADRDSQHAWKDADLVRRPVLLGLGTSLVRFELEQPAAGTLVSAGGTLVGFGWALGASPIRGIDVGLENDWLCPAVLALGRSDIGESYSSHPGSARAGFAFVAVLPSRPAGTASLSLSFHTDAGSVSHSLPLEFTAGPAARGRDVPAAAAVAAEPLAGFSPIRVALEEARIDCSGDLRVRGWAVAARGLRHVEVFFGEQFIGLAETGLPRADVAAAFPDYPSPLTSGFALRLSMPAYQICSERIAVVVTDRVGVTRAATRPANVELDRDMVQPAPRRPGPAPLLAMLEEARIDAAGLLHVRGSAVAVTPVEQVLVLVDEEPLGPAEQNLPRDDVGQAHPAYPNAGTAGFLLRLAVPERYRAGRRARVVVTAAGGERSEVEMPIIAADPRPRRRRRIGPAAEPAASTA